MRSPQLSILGLGLVLNAKIVSIAEYVFLADTVFLNYQRVGKDMTQINNAHTIAPDLQYLYFASIGQIIAYLSVLQEHRGSLVGCICVSVILYRSLAT